MSDFVSVSMEEAHARMDAAWQRIMRGQRISSSRALPQPQPASCPRERYSDEVRGFLSARAGYEVRSDHFLSGVVETFLLSASDHVDRVSAALRRNGPTHGRRFEKRLNPPKFCVLDARTRRIIGATASWLRETGVDWELCSQDRKIEHVVCSLSEDAESPRMPSKLKQYMNNFTDCFTPARVELEEEDVWFYLNEDATSTSVAFRFLDQFNRELNVAYTGYTRISRFASKDRMGRFPLAFLLELRGAVRADLDEIPQWADDEEQNGGSWECADLEEQDYVNVNEATTRWKLLVLRLFFSSSMSIPTETMNLENCCDHDVGSDDETVPFEMIERRVLDEGTLDELRHLAELMGRTRTNTDEHGRR